MSWLSRLLGGAPTAVDATTAAALQKDGGVLLDVRERTEWDAGHAPRATHVPLGQLAGRLREVPRDRLVLTVCASGMRSARAAALLRKEGYDVRNVKGGMSAWERAGLPVERRG